jgi:Txe/YoeB family toxin of Txe-Axe toxin-antitoxin module
METTERFVEDTRKSGGDTRRLGRDREDTDWKMQRDPRYEMQRDLRKTLGKIQRDPEDIHGDPEEIQEDSRSREIRRR